MIIRLPDFTTGLTAWIAEGTSEDDIKQGLASGYIEYEGIRMKVIKTDHWDLGDGRVTKLVHVEMSPELVDTLNTTLVRKAKGRQL